MHFRFGRRLAEIIFLVFTAGALLATSSPISTVESGTFTITSDCVIPTIEKEITTSAGAITSPAATSWTDFGFPNNSVELGNSVEGSISGFFRSCRFTYGAPESNHDVWLWSCFDDGGYTCTIFLKK